VTGSKGGSKPSPCPTWLVQVLGLRYYSQRCWFTVYHFIVYNNEPCSWYRFSRQINTLPLRPTLPVHVIDLQFKSQHWSLSIGLSVYSFIKTPSVKLFLQSSEFGPPQHKSRRQVCSLPPLVGGGGRAHSLAGEGLVESQFQRGDIHYGALYISTL
jgi:hypothetical protein